MITSFKKWLAQILTNIMQSHVLTLIEQHQTTHHKLNILIQNQEKQMAQVSDLAAQVVQAANTVTQLEAAVSALKTTLANSTAGGIQPSALDSVLSDLQNLNTNLSTLTSNLAALTPAAPTA